MRKIKTRSFGLRRVVRVILVAILTWGALTLLRGPAAEGENWDISSLMGLPAGTTTSSVPLSPPADSAAMAEAATVSDAEADVKQPERMTDLQNRYDQWAANRQPVEYLDSLPELPADAGFPPPPDAPDGEVTLEIQAFLDEAIQ